MTEFQHDNYNGSMLWKKTATRITTGNKNIKTPPGSSEPISCGRTLSKCKQGRRRINIACNVKKVKHITVGKLRKQFQAGALWI